MTTPKLKAHVINRDWCKGCGICVEFCPKKLLELGGAECHAARAGNPHPHGFLDLNRKSLELGI